MGQDSGDVAFMAVSCALVLFMTPGLAFFYGGLVRDSNIINTMMMSIVSIGLISVLWMLVGFTLAFKSSFEHFGFRGLKDDEWHGTDIPGLLFAVFQMTFAIIACAIISGAVVERIRFSAFTCFIGLWLLAVYVPLCNWIWGGGWIQQMGAKDFAGGTVVHISSGTSAAVAAYLLGDRKHKEGAYASNIPFVILGGSILWLGWTGFNGGSALAANTQASLAIATTYVAAASGLLAWIAVERVLDGAPTSVGAMSGVVAGLVTITPSAGFVEPLGALATGALGALVCAAAARRFQQLSFVDDSLNCFPLHGVGGFVGAILGGLFDLSDGAFYGNGLRTLFVNFAGALFGVVYSAAVTAAIFLLLKRVMRVRAVDEHELGGLDIHVHSETAYGQRKDNSATAQALNKLQKAQNQAGTDVATDLESTADGSEQNSNSVPQP